MSKFPAMLVAVDVQNDFCPGGALPVQTGNDIVPVVNKLIQNFSHTVLTQEWHPAGHLAFASSHPGKHSFGSTELSYGHQVLWPDHCVQGTKGAEFHPDLLVTNCETIIRTGFRRTTDSYSAFFENDKSTPTGLGGYMRERNVKTLYLCGLATDICVLFSALDARKLGFRVYLVDDACGGIDLHGSLDAAYKEMASAGVVVTNSEKVLSGRN
ncbi:MAG: bifunctional nicotinamidase/pyrazinamidase [Nitrospinae bacterium]|nr:bifunctional nicotinamidase/pyrazinamidase [Nitrospinota bacterium]